MKISITLRFAPPLGTLDLSEERTIAPSIQTHRKAFETARSVSTVLERIRREKHPALQRADGRIQKAGISNGMAIPISTHFSRIVSQRGARGRSCENDAGRVRHEELMKKMYGRTPEEVRRNLVPIRWCPKLANQTLWCTRINQVHIRLSRISAELDGYPELAGYLDSGGIFNWRVIAGSDRLSAHSFGAAIDIAIEHAHYWKRNVSQENGGIPDRPENKFPQIIVDVFEKHGFIWGGRWRHYDTMHFEYRPELLLD